MRSAAVAAVVVAALGCTDTIGAASETTAGSACGCQVEGSAPPTLVMSFSCYCAAYGGCDRTIASTCAHQASYLRRYDYPDCQLSLVATGPHGSWNEDYYDPDGKLVGVTMASDTSMIMCPGDPHLGALNMRAGRTPAGSCRQLACNAGCTVEAFPCAGTTDGGVGQ